MSFGPGFANFFDNLFIFRRCDAVDNIVFVNPLDRLIGWQLKCCERINITKFRSFGHCCTGHTTELVVKTEIVLERNRGQRLVLWLNVDVLFRLNRLVKAFRQTPPFHHTTGKFVNQHDLIIFDDIVFVAMEEFMGFQRLVRMVNDRHVRRIPKRAFNNTVFGQALFHFLEAFFGEDHRAHFFVEIDIFINQIGDELINCPIQFRSVIRRT